MASESDRRPLLASEDSRTAPPAQYGGTSTSESTGPAAVVKEEKVSKKFKEIWALCLGLWTAVFCSALSATIVANLLVDIGSYFKAGSLSSWLGTAYLIGLTAMTPLYGRLAQVIGRKGAMMLALSLFTIGTLGSALAPSMNFILAARLISGAGSGGLLTVTAIIISDLVSIADRGLYQGGVNLLFGAGASTGTVVGGWVGDRFGWRAAFWIQIPAIAIATLLVVTQVHVPMPKSDLTKWQKIKRIDWAGSVVLMVCISTFTLASSLVTSSGYRWSHPLVLGLTAVCGVTIPLFAFIETRATEPILPMSLLTRLQPSIALISFMVLTAAAFGRLYMQPVYLHVTRELNGKQTGLVLLPSSIMGSLSSLYAGWHMRHFREYKWFSVVVSVIFWLQALSIIFLWSPSTSVYRLSAEMAISALGGGAIITSLLTALIATVDSSQMSLAVSAAYLFRAVGQVIGVAISAAIQQSVLLSALTKRLEGSPAEVIRDIIQQPSFAIPQLDAATQLQARLAYLNSIEAVFGFVLAAGVVLTVLCLLVKPHPL